MAAKGTAAEDRAAGDRVTAEGAAPEVESADEAPPARGGGPSGTLCCAVASWKKANATAQMLKFGRGILNMVAAYRKGVGKSMYR